MPPLCGCIPSPHKIADIWRECWRNLKIYWKRFLAKVSKFLSGGKGNQRLLTSLTIEVQLKFFTCLEHWGSFCHICCRKQLLRSYYFWAHCIELHEQPFWNLNCLGQSSGPCQYPWVQIFQLLLSGRLSDGWGLCFPQRGEMKLQRCGHGYLSSDSAWALTDFKMPIIITCVTKLPSYLSCDPAWMW